MIGRKLGRYHIVKAIGAGGMGEVYRARDEQLERDVAIKVLPPANFSDPVARSRLLREARSAAGLNHPYICTVHEVGEADGQAYIAMELVDGQPLSARLAAGALPPEVVTRYGLQLAEAIAHAHARGIIHRDLKSSNVIITAYGRVKVLDFGLAKRLRDEQLEEATRSQLSFTTAGSVVGTLAYMSPEQLRGEPADARGDVWALGVVLYEMAAGKLPFRGQTGFELSSAILNQQPQPLPSKVPASLQARLVGAWPSRRASDIKAPPKSPPHWRAFSQASRLAGSLCATRWRAAGGRSVRQWPQFWHRCLRSMPAACAPDGLAPLPHRTSSRSPCCRWPISPAIPPRNIFRTV